MSVLHPYSMDIAWTSLLARVRALYEFEVKPRGQTTYEAVGWEPLIVDATRPVLTVARRRLGYRFLPAEAAWILSGDNRVETIGPFSKVIASFSDDGETFFGAYGPKIDAQLEYVLDALRRDRSTRQAVINIWRESPPDSRDVPCTLSAQFLVRDRRLYTIVTMRSSDVWLGVPYDVFNFSMLAAYVLLELGDHDLELGALIQHAGSRHLYERNLVPAGYVLGDSSPGFEYAPLEWREFASGQALIDHLWALAHRTPDLTRGRFLTEVLDYEPAKKETHP